MLHSVSVKTVRIIGACRRLRSCQGVNSPFSVPGTTLTLTNFIPRFSRIRCSSLERRLRTFNTNVRIALLTTVPTNSKLKADSVLTSAILKTVGSFYNLT